MPLPDTLRALRYRNFRLFFGGQLISVIGTWMQTIAQSWLVYRMTGSAVLLGAVGFASQIPVFLLSPAGGIVADRYSRRNIVVATQVSAMLLASILAVLTLSGRVRIWHIFVLSALMGVVNSFDIPARQAFLVEMVGRRDLMNAIALNSSMFNASRVVGPAVAGILVATIGEGWCFFANAVSYTAVIAGLLLMHVERRAATQPPASPLENLKEGFRFVLANHPVRSILLLLGVVSVTGMPYSVLMPVFAAQILHGGARALGWLSAVTGLGAISAALLLASRTNLKGMGPWVARSALGFGASLLAYSCSRRLWLSALLLVPVGFSMMLEMGCSNTLLQTMSPDHLRGRVMAVYSMMFMGMAPVGSLLAGAAASRFGAPLTVGAAGAICMAAALVFRFQLPRFRAGARQLIVEQQMAGGDPPR